jgi:hypothetical protein
MSMEVALPLMLSSMCRDVWCRQRLGKALPALASAGTDRLALPLIYRYPRQTFSQPATLTDRQFSRETMDGIAY